MGQQLYKYKNLLNRQFHAETPNSKWVTDISYIPVSYTHLDVYKRQVVGLVPEAVNRYILEKGLYRGISESGAESAYVL